MLTATLVISSRLLDGPLNSSSVSFCGWKPVILFSLITDMADGNMCELSEEKSFFEM